MGFALGEAVILGLMKKVPQDLTIAFNLGKSTGKAMQAISTILASYFGFQYFTHSWVLVFLNPLNHHMMKWVVDHTNSHMAHVSRYKLYEGNTNATVGTSHSEVALRPDQKPLKHIGLFRYETFASKLNVGGRITSLIGKKERLSSETEIT